MKNYIFILSSIIVDSPKSSLKDKYKKRDILDLR